MFVNSMAQGVAQAIFARDSLPGLLRKIIESGAWRAYIVEMMGTLVEFENIEDWIEARAPVGLGTTLEVMMDLLRHHPDLQARLLALVQEGDSP
jgi:hypothetical protein